MQRTVNSALWRDPRVRGLSPDSRLLYIYLHTNEHSHISGLYALPLAYQSYETGLAVDTLEACWQQLEAAGLCKYDARYELVWVVHMLDDVGLQPYKHVKITIAIQNQISLMRHSRLSQVFKKTYKSWFEPQPRLSPGSSEPEARLGRGGNAIAIADATAKTFARAPEESELSTGNGQPAKVKHCGYGTCTQPLAEWSANFCVAHAPEATAAEKARQLEAARAQGLLPPISSST